MICYFGLRHFYVSQQTAPEGPCILTANQSIWDYSPELKSQGITLKTPLKTVRQLRDITLQEICLEDYSKLAKPWLDFCEGWTDKIEIEYPHAWYCQLPDSLCSREMAAALQQQLAPWGISLIWAAGPSKLTAKLGAYQKSGLVLTAETVADFLRTIPLEHWPVPEQKQLQKLGVFTFGDLQQLSQPALCEQFGQRGRDLYLIARGQDSTPFTCREENCIRWKIDITTIPESYPLTDRRQLMFLLKQGAAHLSRQLQQQQKLAVQLAILWTQEMHREQRLRSLPEASSNADVLCAAAAAALPDTVWDSLEIQIEQSQRATSRQLDIFTENPTRQLQTLKSRLGRHLVEISIPRREKVLTMWEMQHL